jgi:hypothetical protein
MIQNQAVEPKHTEVEYSKNLQDIPQLSKLGILTKSSAPLLITEPEEEYVIKVIKHIFPTYVVFEVGLN